MTEAKQLERGASELDVPLRDDQLDALLQFATLLRRWNSAFNLVSRRDVPRLVARHILDALSLAPWLRGQRVLDLGTGAGLPGIPLAIAIPEVQFHLLDRSERRIRFVRQVTIDLSLTNVTPVAADYRDFRPSTLFDTVVSRAVDNTANLWPVAAKLLDANGIALFQVGAQEQSTADLDANVERLPIHVPGLERGHCVLRVGPRERDPQWAQGSDR